MKTKTCCVCGVNCFDPYERNGSFICGQDCLEKFYQNRINELEYSIKKWKDAWFDLRDRVGKLGCKYQIPASYKKDENCSEIELEEKLRLEAVATVEKYYGPLIEKEHNSMEEFTDDLLEILRSINTEEML